MHRLALSLTLLLLAACGACAAPPPVATPAPAPGLTFTPSPTPASTPTPSPASTATPTPIRGTLTIKVNVRRAPGTDFASLGQLNSGEQVLIIARDESGKWYRILFPAAPGGSGWVSAQYVQIAANAAIPLAAASTPTGPGGRVLLRLNVRSGPGLTFNSLGMLAPDVLVSLTGKNSTASWFQIDYPAAPGGHGWVTAQYIQTDAAAGLPVLDDFGTQVPGAKTGAASVFVTPTPTIGPAIADGDSRTNPAIRVTFSASGTRQFNYSSQVSAPDGDLEDWVEFTPYASLGTAARLVFSLACRGNDTLTVELWQGGSALAGWGTLSCGNIDRALTLTAGQTYAIRLAPAPGAGLRLVDYILSVQNIP
jgi:uncharacterized protein YraI